MLPDGWHSSTVAESGVTVIDGDRGREYPSQGDFLQSGHCLFLNAKNVTKSGFRFDETQFISEQKDLKLRKGKLKRDDIVLTTRGTTGNVAHFVDATPFDHVRINSGMVILRSANANVNANYLYLLLRSSLISRQIERQSFGSAQPQLTVSIIKKFRFPLPPVKEQSAVVDIISTWDQAIEKTEKLIANSQAQKKALMQQLLTGQKRLPGFMGEWSSANLAKIATITKGKQKSKITLSDNGNYPVINGGVEPSGYSDEFNTSGGTITISEGGNSCGFVNLIERNFWSGGHCYTLLDLKVDRDYLYHFLKSEERQIMRLRVGSGLPNIQKSTISKYPVSIPPEEEQKAIAGVLNTAAGIEDGYRQHLKALHLQKSALMQQLLTGKRRVKVDGHSNG